MIKVFVSAWALFLGIMMLQVGNGMQSTLLGIRGNLAQFSTFDMSIVMSGYFVGFLGGSKLAPEMIRRVGHVRVFAALGSMVSAVLILYPTFVDPIAWTCARIVLGFCLSGVYVTAESWLNHAVSNENRGKALSLYLIMQMLGIISAQGLLVMGDPSGFVLFIIPSVLVSISFAPILLSVTPTPAFQSSKPMKMSELFVSSPLGCVGVFLLGAVFAAQFGMAAVFGTQAGLSVGQISTFVATFYTGAILLQYPIGWISDRMDRRMLIGIVSGLGALGGVVGFLAGSEFTLLLISAFIIGGTSNPLYALLIAHANDFLDHENMASAAGTMVFANGLGAIAGPLATGWIMGAVGPRGFFLYMLILMAMIAAYAVYRASRRAAVSIDEAGAMSPIIAGSTAVAVEAAQEWSLDAMLDDEGNSLEEKKI